MRFQFRTALIVSSLVIIGLLSGTILIAQWLIGKKAADEVAHNIFGTTASKIQTQVNNLIDVPLKLSGMIAHHQLIEKPRDGGLDAPVRHQIFKALAEYPSIYSIYIGHDDGSFYQIIATRGHAAVLDKHQAPQNAAWIVRTIYSEPRGSRTQSWSFLDDQKNLLKAHTEPAPGYDPRKRPWYEAATSGSGAALSDVYMFNSLQQPGITASHTLMDKTGVVGVDVTLSGLSQYVSEQKLSENSVVFIYDSKNRILALPETFKEVPLLSDAAKVPSEAVKSLFDASKKDDFYSAGRELLHDGPGFKSGIAAPKSDFTRIYRDMQQKIFFIILASLVVFVPLMMYFSQRLAKRVKHLADDAKKIRNGDFSQSGRPATKIIELSALEDSFSDMREALFAAEQLRQKQEKAHNEREQYILEFEQSMASVFDGLGSADKAMQQTSSEMQSIAQHTKQQSSAVSVSAEATSSNVTTVAGASEKMSESIAHIASQVAEATESTTKAVKDATNTSEKIRILEDHVGQISKLVAMIQEIAAQTNILALNATVESARAGEAGKGFAVVAAEVKGLAHQTAQATEKISEQIDVIQASTKASVGAINEVSTTIEQVQAISALIAQAMEQQRATTSEIASNVEQAAAQTQNVSTQIQRLQETAERSEAASNNIGDAARNLSSQGEVLRKTVGAFLSRVHATEG